MWKEEAPLLTRQTTFVGQCDMIFNVIAWVHFVPIFLLKDGGVDYQ